MRSSSSAWQVRVAVARLHALVGWQGLVGLGLTAIAAVTMTLAWRDHRAVVTSDWPAAPPEEQRELPRPAELAIAALPPAADVPQILGRIERLAVATGFGWPKAEYRVNPVRADAPANVEVQCTFKVGYPTLRQFVTALLRDMPTMTLREFVVSRPNAQTADVEGRLSIVIYLASSSRASANGER